MATTLINDSLAYEYLPYYVADSDGTAGKREIPCFRIHPEDDAERFVAQTNEDLPRDVQEANARLFTAAPQLLEALDYFFNIMHDYPSSVRKGYVKHAMDLARAALSSAKGSPV